MASMQIKIGRGAAACVLAVAAMAAQAQCRSQAADAAFGEGRYAQALALYLGASDAGDAWAAERAGEMLLLGPVLYGSQVPQDFERALRHLVRAARDGRPAAIAWLERIGYPPVWQPIAVASRSGC
jgi:TPR repeat protein